MYSSEEIIKAIQTAQEKLKQQRLERPVILCHKNMENLFSKWYPEANIIVVPEVPSQGLYIIDKELRRYINQQSEESED